MIDFVDAVRIVEYGEDMPLGKRLPRQFRLWLRISRSPSLSVDHDAAVTARADDPPRHRAPRNRVDGPFVRCRQPPLLPPFLLYARRPDDARQRRHRRL